MSTLDPLCSLDEALKQLMPILRRYIHSILVTRSLHANTDDVLQKVLMVLADRWQDCTDTKHAECQAFTTAYRACIDLIRGQRITYELRASDLTNKLEEQFQIPIENLELAKAVHELDDVDRMVIISHYFDKMTFKEIGAVLNKPETTVRKIAERARKKLYKCLLNIGE